MPIRVAELAGGETAASSTTGESSIAECRCVDQAVDDLELAGGVIFAGEAAEQRFDEVVDEPGEDARGLGGIEAGDFVAPPFAADLVERRLEAAGDELFVEAWGANKPIMNDEL